MLAGLGVSVYYLATTQPWLREALHLHGPVGLWWGIQPISAGVFGVPAGLIVTVVVSLATPRPPATLAAFVDDIRDPRGEPPAQAGPVSPVRPGMP
jgi:cation/acetate symporter